MTPILAALALALLAPPAAAQEFAVTLGGGEIGRLAFAVEGEGQLALDATLTDTPFGVADGTFHATSRPAQLESGEVVRQYLGESAFSSGGRTVSILHDGGRVIATDIRPEEDRTAYSDAGQVPPGVLDPAEAFGRLATATACPDPFRIYDGRRVAEIAAAPAGDGATCEGTYRVIAGRGHLSPLGITGFDFTLAYTPDGLASFEIRTGLFTLRLDR